MTYRRYHLLLLVSHKQAMSGNRQNSLHDRLFNTTVPLDLGVWHCLLKQNVLRNLTRRWLILLPPKIKVTALQLTATDW